MTVSVEKMVAMHNLNESAFLGRLLWFTVSDLRVTREQLAEALSRNTIDQKHLPKPISPRDAFRRATKEAEQKHIPMDDGRKLNLMVREVRADNDKIIRHLVREVVDSTNVRLEYTEVAALVLSGENYAYAVIQPLNDQEQAAVEAVGAAYEDARRNYHGRHIRDLVTGILGECDPVAVRPSGGVYFAPRKHDTTIIHLQDLVKELGAYTVTSERSQMWSVPVLDAEDQRAMLTESLEDQVKNEAEALITDMTPIIKGEKKVTQAAATKYVERVKALKATVREYEEMLQGEITSAQANLEAAMAQAMMVLERVEVDA